ncbi:hypothetical protein L208DRAFT_1278553, partial [Tricholoma matsutake]
ESTLECPDCGSNVQVGTGRQKNLDIHHTSKPCHAEREQQNTCTWPKPEAKPNQSLHSFFKARAAPNPPLVSALAPIHAPKVGAEQTADADDNLRPLEVMPRSDSMTDDADACMIASELLSQLHIAIEQIPSETPLAMVGNPLSEFSKDPSTLVQGPAVDNWEEVLNPMMKRAFGWGEDAIHAAAKGMMQWGSIWI